MIQLKIPSGEQARELVVEICHLVDVHSQLVHRISPQCEFPVQDYDFARRQQHLLAVRVGVDGAERTGSDWVDGGSLGGVGGSGPMQVPGNASRRPSASEL